MEEFKDKHIGKRMPYSLPPGFFESITQKTLQRAQEEDVPVPVHGSSSVKWRVLSVAASLVLLITFSFFLRNKENTPETKPTVAMSDQMPLPEKGKEAPTLPQQQELSSIKDSLPKATSLAKITKKPSPDLETPQQTTIKKQDESLDDILATLSDEELSQLATITESETTALEETTLK